MKTIGKFLKWIFLCVFLVIIIFSIVSMVGGDPDAVYALIFGIICFVLTIIFSRKKPQNGTQVVPKKAKEPQKFWRTKSFDIEGFNINNLNGCFNFNDEFDYTVSEIKENSLEDWKIYKFEFDLKPVFTRSETGAVRIMADDRVIGDLSNETATELKEFINSHEGCKPRLEIKGGEFRIYDSEEKTVERGRDPWEATLIVSYYG